jgi:hypothetical protein
MMITDAARASIERIMAEPSESFEWCPPVWFNEIYDDYEIYCKSEHSLWSNPKDNNLEMGWNPVYQGRNVAQYSKSHETLKVSTVDEGNNMHDPNAPCGTSPLEIV